jgi:RHS repeat-associated protein
VKLRASGGDTVVGDYQYDGKGQRAVKTTTTVTSHFIYGPNGELLGEYQSNGTPVSEFIYLSGQPLAVYATQTETLPPTPPIDLTVDNDGAGTSSTGSWTLKTNAKDYGANYREGNSTDTYRWTPPAISGIFEVYAWWMADRKYSKVANYTISHNGGSNVVVKSHTANGGAWQLLGTYVFNGSGTGTEYVQLHAADGKKISADAIRFKQLGGSGGSTITTVGTYFVHTDHLGTPRSVSNDAQTVVWRWDSGPFGHSAPNEDPDGNSKPFVLNLRFPGQYFDAESALNYNYFRDYDPSTGRYVESDPIGLSGGLNSFAYVGGNPVSNTDPTGLETYQCKRPLGKLPGENRRSGPDIWGNPFYHQYSCTRDVRGMLVCGGQSFTQSWLSSPGKPTTPATDFYSDDACRQSQGDNRCFEQCLIDEWKIPRPRYGIPFGTDCQEYDDAVNSHCLKECTVK